jgi:hypothetical protein
MSIEADGPPPKDCPRPEPMVTSPSCTRDDDRSFPKNSRLVDTHVNETEEVGDGQADCSREAARRLARGNIGRNGR